MCHRDGTGRTWMCHRDDRDDQVKAAKPARRADPHGRGSMDTDNAGKIGAGKLEGGKERGWPEGTSRRMRCVEFLFFRNSQGDPKNRRRQPHGLIQGRERLGELFFCFFAAVAHNQLKNHDSDERIQENPSAVFLDFLGLAWSGFGKIWPKTQSSGSASAMRPRSVRTTQFPACRSIRSTRPAPGR